MASSPLSHFGGKLPEIAASNRGCFVLVAMLKVNGVKSDALEELKKNESKIKKPAGKKMKAGQVALLKALKDS